MGLQVLTAYRLLDGHVVYFGRDGAWTEWVEDSMVVDDEAAAKQLQAKGDAAVLAQEVFDPYLIGVARASGAPRPVTYREVLRADGPSVHPAFGYQAERKERGR